MFQLKYNPTTSIFTCASASIVGSKAPRPWAARWVCGYQQWLKCEPGGYASRERNSITGKWPVIETIPGIPKPTLHQCWCWHELAFHYYRLLRRMLMSRHSTWRYGEVRYNASSNISFQWWFVMWHVQWSPDFQSVQGQLLSLSPLLTVLWFMNWTWVTIWSGACMGGHWRTGWDEPVQLNHRQYLKQCL